MIPRQNPQPGPIVRPFATSLLLACAAAASCASGPLEESQVEGVPYQEGDDPLLTVARLEDARSDGEGLLFRLVARGDAETRRRAALALGRLDPEVFGSAVSDALHRALEDGEPSVRAAAAFAIGQRGDPASAEALLAARRDEDDEVRARVIEAMSRVPDGRLWEEVLFALDDPAREVRIEAVAGPQRWPGAARGLIDPDLVDNALLNVTLRVGRREGARPIAPEDPEVVWRAIQSLQRRARLASENERAPFERAREGFLFWARSDGSPEARLFAVMGLRYLSGTVQHDSSLALLRQATRSGDWRVVVEALRALGDHRHPDNVEAIVAAARHPSSHVRRTALETLGAHFSDRDEALPVVERARVDPSSSVRAAALETRARILRDEAAPVLELGALDHDPVVRAGAARAARFLGSERALPLLEQLSRDESRFVAYAAVEAMEAHLGPETRGRLFSLLRGADNGLRLAAVLALRGAPRPEDLPHLRHAFEQSTGDVATEVRFNALENAARIGGPDALALLELGLEADEPFVRKTARRLITQLDPTRVSAPPGPRPLTGEVPPAPRGRPIVELSTTRGRMVFELFPEDAPLHVYNFLALAERDHYDGLTFHRVVPDFVIQGGDYRGDGNGASTWRGEPLRQELNPRKYVRGALGMPRNDDLDSGGSQIFVTHRPTPHLDGRYTLFGQLVEGGEVLDAVEVGDVILDVRVRE